MHALFRVSCTGLIVIAAIAGNMTAFTKISIALESDKISPTVDTTQERSLQDTSLQTNVNRDFNLNIKDENIIEKDYKASTSISIGELGTRSLSLRVGATVSANEINMHLHNIYGRVRFRSNWESLQQNRRSLSDQNSTFERK